MTQADSASPDRPIVHLICNAHLDPVWMWTWEEGALEALSTFRTAADLLDEFPEFIFNHNESLLYAWIEEYDPALFERIRALVAAGRWHIAGGWYLQPDCNLSGGETITRVIMAGRRYFAAKFGARPTIAYNFDIFGHPGTLPGLLKQSGFAGYVHFRPNELQLDLPGSLYRWRGVDGSEVVALRPPWGWWYGTGLGDHPLEQARKAVDYARQSGQDFFLAWGVGDHGGGASRAQLRQLRELIAELEDGDVIMRHSTPEAFFARALAQQGQPPLYEGELQRTFTGCYTSVAPIKRAHRQTEALLAAAERWATVAWWRSGQPYPAEELRAAWERLMFNSFHDILPGSLIEHAIPDAQQMTGYAQDVARCARLKAQWAVLPAADLEPETLPVYVYNPHSAPLREPVGHNFLSAYSPPPTDRPFALYDDTGQPVPHQKSGGATIQADGTWQPFVGFVADVPPLSARRYEIRFVDEPSPPAGPLSLVNHKRGIVVENAWWRLRFDHATAALTEWVERASGRDLLRGPVQLFAMRDVPMAWGGEENVIFNEPVSAFAALTRAEVGDFCGMEGHEGPPLRVLHQGPVSITVEGLARWQHTRAAVQMTLYADVPYLDVTVRLYMQARAKMIKLVWPFALDEPRAVVETPYGTAERAADATERAAQRWLRLETPAMTVGVANNGQYGFDASADGALGLSLSRGGTHSSWDMGEVDTARSYTFMDQTQIDTRFRLLAGPDAGAVAADLIPAALALNLPPDVFFTCAPPPAAPDAPARQTPFLAVEPPTVIVGALKQAEDGDGLIVRLVESLGQPVEATVQLDDGPARTVAFAPHEIKTWRVTRRPDADAPAWQPCNLIEEPLS